MHAQADVDRAIHAADAAFQIWRAVPAPKRGELVRLFAEELRVRKTALGRLVAIESGKILQEGLGEVEEMIDICGFAAGLSRQLYGRTIASERPGHRMMETWHPLGVVGIISAFNFPVAVWAWNAAIALVCGDTLVWKPSEKTPLCVLACQALLDRAAKGLEWIPPWLSAVILGGPELGQALAGNPLVPLVSATGSTRMGRAVAPRIAERFGRSILELGGNNGALVTPSADLDLAARAVLFAAVGTAGQRCTSLRRLFLHESLYDQFVCRLKADNAQVRIGNPLDDGTLIGPLIDRGAFEAMQASLSEARSDGGTITGGERVFGELWPEAYYVRPALVEIAGLRDRQRQRRTFRSRDRRCIRRRKGNRRRPRGGKRCLEGLYAAGHQHDQFFEGIAARAGHPLRSAARRAQQSELGLTGSLAMDPRASRVPEDWGHGFAGSCALADAAAHARF